MQYIIGRKPVLEALEAGAEIQKIFIAHGQHGDVINKIINLARKERIKIVEISPSKLRDLEKGLNSQGVVALKIEYQFKSVDEILNAAKDKKYPLLLLLDQIQDPHNLGAIFRSAECAGVDGIIITTHQSATITETVEKSSAGAVSHLKICAVNNLNNVMKELKDKGYWIIGSSLDKSEEYNKVDYKMPVALVMGNEEKGIRKLVAQNCDILVRIPMMGKIQSLNVSVATGVLLFEISRQRGNG